MSRKGVPDAIDFFKVMFRAIRIELYQQGINIDPVLSEAGYRVGGALYAYIGSQDREELLSNLAEFWAGHGLGRMAIRARSPLIIDVYDCFECAELPLLGRPACAFDLDLWCHVHQHQRCRVQVGFTNGDEADTAPHGRSHQDRSLPSKRLHHTDQILNHVVLPVFVRRCPSGIPMTSGIESYGVIAGIP